MLVDTHIHLDLSKNMKALIQEIQLSDIGVIAVGTTPKAYSQEVLFCSGGGNIKVALGLHPQLILERNHEIELFLKQARNAKIIGEIGLDFNSTHISSKEEQLLCFRKIANFCAEEGNKVLSIHSVKAASKVVDELETSGAFRSCICILHWFSGTTRELRRAIDAGAYFSINPRMLMTKSGCEVIKTVPKDKLLLETDAPFSFECTSADILMNELEKLVDGISSIRGIDMREQIEETSMIIWGDN